MSDGHVAALKYLSEKGGLLTINLGTPSWERACSRMMGFASKLAYMDVPQFARDFSVLARRKGLRAYIRSVCAALVAADPDGIRRSMPLLPRGFEDPSELEG